MDSELKKIRLSKHETQAKIASTVGIDVKTYRRYENGKHRFRRLTPHIVWRDITIS